MANNEVDKIAQLKHRVDFHPWQAHKVLANTAREYSKEVSAFNAWLKFNHLQICDLEILDDALVQYASIHNLSTSKLANLYAGVSLALPKARRKLPWTSAILAGAQRLMPAQHTLPMPKLVHL